MLDAAADDNIESASSPVTLVNGIMQSSQFWGEKPADASFFPILGHFLL